MKQKIRNIPEKTNASGLRAGFGIVGRIHELPAWILGLTLFLTPLFPDEKLNRLKLMALGIGLIAAVLAWALSCALNEELIIYRTPLDVFMALYFFTAALYYGFSANPAVAASELQRMIFSAVAFFITVQSCSGERGRRSRMIVFAGWITGFFLIAIYGLLQKTGGVGRIAVPQLSRVFGTFGNPIFFAAFLIATIPVVLGLLLQTGSFLLRASLFVCLIVGSSALFCTGTRAAFLSLPASLFVFCLALEKVRGWRWALSVWRGKWKILSFMLVIVAAHITLVTTSGAYRNFSNAAKAEIEASRATSTQQTHTLIWKDVFRMWKAHPWFGTGYGTFHVEFPQYASEELKKVFPPTQRIVNDAHNEYLQILAETGIVGFTVFMSLIFVFYFTALRRLFSGIAENEVVIYAGLLSGGFALFLQNIFSVDMRFIVSSAYFFLTMGIASSYLSKPAVFRWAAGRHPVFLRSAWVLIFVLLSGLVGISVNSKALYALGIYEYSSDPRGVWSWKITPASGPGLLPALLRPYMSQRVVAATPDFFDEKLLDSAKNINDLENLTKQYPGQWKYWEKLGWALAKEIQMKDAQGKKLLKMDFAERAIASYKTANELNPKAEGPLNNIGNIYYTVGRRTEALEWWKKVIDINPENIDARLNLGLAYYYEGRIKESAAQFEEVLKREPKNEKAIVMLKRMVE